MFKFHRKCSDQVIEKETLSAEIANLKSTISSLKNSPPQIIKNRNFDFESTFEKLRQIINSSMNYNEQYHKQRDSLFQIVQKQNIIIDQYEKIIQESKNNNNNSSLSTTKVNISNFSNLNEPITDDVDALYSVLGAITRLVMDTKDNFIKEGITSISENSSQTVQERIIEIFRLVLKNDKNTKWK